MKKFLEYISQLECFIALRWSSNAHKRLKFIQWKLLPEPKFFDHSIDLNYQWLETQNPQWLERGVLSSLFLKGGNVLELFCGDGFYTRNFYAIKSKKIIACDISTDAINLARKKNNLENIDYRVMNVMHKLPAGKYDNVIMDFAFSFFEYFTHNEIIILLKNIKNVLSDNGVLTGTTMLNSNENLDFARKNNKVSNIKLIFESNFNYINILTTEFNGRLNIYFQCSDNPLPVLIRNN